MAADPKSARAHYLVGIAAAHPYDVAKAGTAFQRAAGLAPDDVGTRQALLGYGIWETRGGRWSVSDDPLVAIFTR